jgi:elongation factor G
MGDLQTRRALVEGLESEGHFSRIRAQVPLAELYEYASSLRSITQGRARFNVQFDHYAPVPYELQKKLMEEYSRQAELVE